MVSLTNSRLSPQIGKESPSLEKTLTHTCQDPMDPNPLSHAGDLAAETLYVADHTTLKNKTLAIA
jgi:hypothetical protein